jgi:hypothetical protein
MLHHSNRDTAFGGIGGVKEFTPLTSTTLSSTVCFRKVELAQKEMQQYGNHSVSEWTIATNSQLNIRIDRATQ